MRMADDRSGRWWGIGLATAGIGVLGIAVVLAFGIIGDPGGSYDGWIGDSEPLGPEASFDWVSDGLLVDFADTSSAGDTAVEGWSWEFADGAVSDEPNPAFRFDGEGEWTVTLQIVDGNGLTSTAEAAVGVEPGVAHSGSGAIGLSDLADRVIATVENASKGALVVVLVIAMLVIMTMVGGRLVKAGTRTLRPVPERVEVKLRPKSVALEMRREIEATSPAPVEIDERIEVGV